MNNQKLVTAFLACLALAGCQPDSPDDRLLETADEVQDVREEIGEAGEQVAEASDELAASEQAVEAAEIELQKSRERLQTLQRQHTEERELLRRMANDVALFRLIQKQLLEEPQLADTAVSVSADNGVVSLRGALNSEQDVALAIGIASQAPGVKSVRNLLDVEQGNQEQ
jgi:osmotically-inducible protein OsmY